MRRQSDRPARNAQGWLHFFDDTSPSPIRSPLTRLRPQPAAADRADVERCHAVYTAFLSALTLLPEHQQELMRRGLPSEEIERLQYRSVPSEMPATNLMRSLSLRYNLGGVPGFYEQQDGWRMVRTSPGFFIPYRNERGMIEGLQLRRFPDGGQDKYLWLSSKDKPSGASSGSPVHFANTHLLATTDEIVITEGALKADVATYLSASPVIAAAGVSNFGDGFAARLKISFPKLRCAVIAFDRDLAHNAQVHRALLHLCRQLEGARFQVRVRTWPPPAKGYDDYLLSQLTIGRSHR